VTESSLHLAVTGSVGSSGGGKTMFDSYVIEVSSKTAGIVVRDKSGFRFFASNHDFDSLEGRYFRSAREAERAAILFLQTKDNNKDDKAREKVA
jgi:hypothetical protein